MSDNRLVIEVVVDPDGKASVALRDLEGDVHRFAGSTDKAGQSGLKLRDVFAGNLLAEFFQRGTSAAIQFGAQAVQAAAAASDANRTLEASATQAGLTYDEAARKAEDFGKRVGLSNTEASRTYADLIRLAAQAGRPEDSDLIANKFADLAAARGVSARELSTISQQIITGQDEGLNKLGLPDPSKLYAEYADKLSAVSGAAKRTAESLSQVEKANAAVTAVMEKSALFDGAAEDRLYSTAGRLDTLSAKYGDLTTALGNAITANGLYNDLLTGTLALVGQFSAAGQTQIQDAAKTADEAVESTAGKLTTRVRQTATLLYGAGEFLLGVIKTGVSFAEDLGKLDPIFGEQGLFGSEQLFQGTREGLANLERVSIEGKEAIFNAENRLREATVKEVEANNARIVQQEVKAEQQKLTLAEQTAKQIAQQRTGTAAAAVKEVARIEEQSAKEAAEARKKVASDAQKDADELFKFVSQHAGKNNPYVAIFTEAQEASDSFNRTSEALRNTFGATADELIGKLEGLTAAKRAALAESGVEQRFEDQLEALGLRQEAEALRNTPPPVTAKEAAQDVRGFSESGTATIEAARRAMPVRASSAQYAQSDPTLAYFGPDSPFAPKPEQTPERATAAATLAEFLRSRDTGRIVGDSVAAFSTYAPAQDSPAVTNAREAIDLIRRLEAEATAGGLDAGAAHRIANEQILKRVKGVGAEALGENPDLRELLADALDSKAERISNREQEAKKLVEDEQKSRKDFTAALQSFVEQMKGFGINITLDKGLDVDVLGAAPRAEDNLIWNP